MDQVSQIREKTDIVALIQEYVPLKKAGSNYKALCPFHQDKTPSFVVSPERQIWHCFGCFPPGELVKTPFGYHAIETIDENHWVVSGKGNVQKVTQVMTHQYKGDLITVALRKLRDTVRLTSDHTVFAIRPAPYMQREYKNFSRKYNTYLGLRAYSKEKYKKKLDTYLPIREIQAGELQKGDLLLYPISRKKSDIKSIDLSQYITKKTRLGPVPRKIPLSIPLSAKFLKLIGYYVAEGSSHRAYVRFSLGNHEENFAQEIVDIFKQIFGLEAKIYRRKSIKKTGLEITACHSILANIFENLCGKGASQKHIPFVFQELKQSKQKILLEAIHRGDGTSFEANKSTNVHKSITTTSQILAEQLVDFLLRLQLFPTKSIQKAKVDKKYIKHKKSFMIGWSHEAKQKYNLIYYHPDGSEYWMLPIVELGKEIYEGPVHNFTVENDHSYIATNFAVANCGKGGDCFSFLMEYEHMEFPESLRILADKAGVPLSHWKIDTQTLSKKEKIYTLNHLAAEFYHFLLTKHQLGKQALSYVEKRGIKPQTVNTYMLGFSPHGASLVTYLHKKKGYSVDDIFDAGLAVRRGKDVVDFFQERLMFPLYDHRGNIIGFSGRVLKADEKTSKYINTRETLAYHKGLTFFGLNSARESIKKSETALLMEGEFDVISSFQEGITNAVAVKGTAVTADQVNLLSRFAKKVQLCFDMDKAGQEALKRSLPLFEKKGMSVTVIVVPHGKDADEAIKTDPIAFKKAVKNDVGVYDYLIEKAMQTYDVSSSSGKKQIGDEILPLVAAIDNEIVKEHYVQLLGKTIKTSYDALLKAIEKLKKEKVIQRENVSPLPVVLREEKLEEYLVGLLVQSPYVSVLFVLLEEFLAEYQWRVLSLGKVVLHVKTFISAHPNGLAIDCVDSMPEELLSAFDTCFLLPLPSLVNENEWREEVKKTQQELSILYWKEQMRKISGKISEKEKNGTQEEIIALQEEFTRYAGKLGKKS